MGFSTLHAQFAATCVCGYSFPTNRKGGVYRWHRAGCEPWIVFKESWSRQCDCGCGSVTPFMADFVPGHQLKIQRIRATAIGRPKSEETRRKISISKLGSRWSTTARKHHMAALERPGMKEAISEKSRKWWATARGTSLVPEHLRHKSPEMRVKLSAAAKKQWERDGDRLRAISRHPRNGRQPSRPALLLIDAMRKANLWSGFGTEVPVFVYSIDIANTETKLAIEVDGCYWHGCEACGFSAETLFRRKNRRIARSKETFLKKHGWSVLRIWEHEINRDMENVLGNIRMEVERRF